MDVDEQRDRTRRFAELLRGFDLPKPFELTDLCEAVAAVRGRPLRLLPLPGPVDAGAGAVCGVWLAFGSVDHVYYAPVTSPVHQTHIVLHELAHMLLDHRQPSTAAPEMLAQLFPDLDPAMAARLLARGQHGATSAQEQEAELLASMMWQRFNVAPLTAATASAEHANTLRRVIDSFRGSASKARSGSRPGAGAVVGPRSGSRSGSGRRRPS
ncbi:MULTISPECIES: hypothetical protein [Kitasatospora]|uniref:IrrE N-terminal-like domain-containing protein n=1 Tax=Kitasatospora cathayae TaxID=3004092 RepID=A0ABY7PXQ8_9ACTN|nr:hypothetical protein [Kitasatospora sp. HUAS 3-15]WBP85215.1 hypothetical protein O1G21_04665 [Kitasatospora sp. HUAS 3-15]